MLANENREADRREMHSKLIEQYSQLIPVLSYLKNSKEIDEFNTPECIVCMEDFENGI